MKRSLWLLISFSLAAELAVASAQSVELQTTAGALLGVEDDGIRVFKGIPYAQPPVGDLRWRPPQPLQWEGRYQATEFSLPCPQPTNADGSPNGAGVAGETDEDCLYLNVWAPAAAESAPVMLWIYGGGGIAGAGSVPTYDGSAFARQGVVLVTINYRLGALGGFSHPALTAEARGRGETFGNYHLLDAMAALRWIKQNARAFGGDPENITVFGESAGATITANLLTSPMAKGLFNKAIVQSTGSLPTPATPLEEAEQRGIATFAELGVASDATAAELRAIPAATIVGNRKAGWGVRTILDGQIKTQSILDSFADSNEIDVPTILGTNSDEGRLRGTQLVASHAQDGAPVWQYFFDYVPDWRREEQPNGAPHAAEIPYVFNNLRADRRGDEMTKKDQTVAVYLQSCWLAFVRADPKADSIKCAGDFVWPARSDDNNRRVAIFQERPSLGHAEDLRSPPNGAEPGPTSRP